MKYRYTVRKELFVTVEIEAGSEDEADVLYDSMHSSGEITDLFRDEVLETYDEVYEVNELRQDGWYRIYGIEYEEA